MLRLFRTSRTAQPPGREHSAKALERAALPLRTRIYAVGDVHGRSDLLRQVFGRIDRDLARDPPGRALEVLLGDYVDRGPDSRGVIEAVLERRASREMICLSGNHEDFLLGFLRNPSILPAWRNVGGRETLLSYGVTLPPRLDRAAMQAVAERFRHALPPEHHRFLTTLSLSHEEGGYYFVHAGVRPGVALAQQAAHDLLWIRDEFLHHPGSFGRIVVHGHTPAEEPEVRPNRINIDTGAVFTGNLTCLVLEGEGHRFL